MSEAKLPEEITKLTFEEALEQLEGIVGNLERGDVALGESIEAYERGEMLKKHCQTLLRAAEDKVEKIRLDADGKPVGVEKLDEA